MRTRRQRANRRAAAAMEFAILTPVLLTIMLACVDFGRFAYSYIALTNAAGSGASVASVTPYTAATASTWTSKVTSAVTDEMSQLPNYDVSKLTISAPAPVADGDLQRVSVTVSYPFATLINWPGIPASVTLSRTVSMRVIR